MTSAETMHFDVHGLRIRVEGADALAGGVIHEDLQWFKGEPADPDLTVHLGSAPDVSTRLRSLSPDMLLDLEHDQLVVLHRPDTSVRGTRNIRYVIRGDVRTASGPFSVHIPKLSKERSPWTKGIRALRGKFAHRHVDQANEIMGNIIEAFLYYRLPAKGRTFVHAGAFDRNAGLLLFGASSVGKTLFTMRFVESGAAFLGDDLVVLDADGQVGCYPKRLNLQGHDLTLYPGLVDRLAARMSAVERFGFLRFVRLRRGRLFDAPLRRPISDVFPDVVVRSSCVLRCAVHVVRASDAAPAIREIDSDAAPAMLAANLFWEFGTQKWRPRQINMAFSYAAYNDFVAEELDHQRRVEAILAAALAQTRTFELQLPPSLDASTIARTIELLSSVP